MTEGYEDRPPLSLGPIPALDPDPLLDLPDLIREALAGGLLVLLVGELLQPGRSVGRRVDSPRACHPPVGLALVVVPDQRSDAQRGEGDDGDDGDDEGDGDPPGEAAPGLTGARRVPRLRHPQILALAHPQAEVATRQRPWPAASARPWPFSSPLLHVLERLGEVPLVALQVEGLVA